jgi:hypothetical protein
LTWRASELIGTMGMSSPMRTLPEGLMKLPSLIALITSSGDIW